MQLLTILQESKVYDAGYSIGYTVGKYLPYIILVIAAIVIFIIIKKKSKK